MDQYDDLTKAPDDSLWNRLGEVQGLDRADVLMELGRRAAQLNESSRAVALYEEAASEAEQAEDSRLGAYARYMEGGQRFAMADYSGSSEAYLRSVEQSKAIGRQSDQALALWGRADALRAAGDFEAAVEAATSCRSLAEADGAAELGGDACLVLARAYYYLDREEEALDACLAGRDLYRSVQAAEKVASVDDFALTVHLYLGNLDEALELARSCYVLALTTPSPSDDGYATRRLAEVHLRRGESSAARERAEEAREMYRTGEVMIGVARSDRIRARVLFEEGEAEQALEVFTEARVLFDSVGADSEARWCDIDRSMLLHNLGQYREAAALNRRLVDAFAEESPDLPWAVIRLADNYLAAGDEESALEVLESRMHLWEEGDAPNRASRRWAFELAARALRDTVHLEDAARIAGLALELTDEDEISYRTAEMYEIRARWLLDSGSGQGRQELAQAIAIHLAFGSTERARELSKYFMPEGRSRHDETPEHGSDAWDGDLKAA